MTEEEVEDLQRQIKEMQEKIGEYNREKYKKEEDLALNNLIKIKDELLGKYVERRDKTDDHNFYKIINVYKYGSCYIVIRGIRSFLTTDDIFDNDSSDFEDGIPLGNSGLIFVEEDIYRYSSTNIDLNDFWDVYKISSKEKFIEETEKQFKKLLNYKKIE